VGISAGSLTIVNGATISSDTTGGSGNAGAVALSIGGAISIAGNASAGATTGIVSQSNPGSTGDAGLILVEAGSLSISGGGRISSTTFGPGDAGAVGLYVTGPVTITGTTAPGVTTGIFSSANAGGPGDAGLVTLNAGSLTIAAGGQIATNTTGPGIGGDIDVTVGGNILLTGSGPQITAGSSAGGDAGSISVSAANMTLQSGASIATQAATANGGDINLKIGNFLYLVKSRITTSVLGANGNGGNITIDPLLLVLDSSSIIAQAVAGHGGDISINAGDFIATPDSIVSASSQLGISGTIELIGPRVDLNGSGGAVERAEERGRDRAHELRGAWPAAIEPGRCRAWRSAARHRGGDPRPLPRRPRPRARCRADHRRDAIPGLADAPKPADPPSHHGMRVSDGPPENLDGGSEISRYGPVMRCHAIAQVEHHLVDIAPPPALGWIVPFDDRVPRPVEVPCRMPVRRVITAPDMTAGPAQAQMDPALA
jgi:hypothetical protein